MILKFLARIKEEIVWNCNVVLSAAIRFYWDDCFSRAAALSYTTLFALVPVTALSFSMFSVFGVGRDQVVGTLRAIMEQIMPTINNSQLKIFQEQVIQHLEQFAFNVQALNTVSIAALVFTCVALLNTIESALNVIWRVSSTFTLSKIASFWTVVTLGPLFIALSIYWTTRISALGLDTEQWSWLYLFTISYIVPVFVTLLGLCLLFYKLPASRVRFRDALLGALVAAVLFEFVKRGFAYYVAMSTTNSTIYGVVATIPLFLFWLYVAWVVVLFGAEISYQAGSIHILSGLRRYATDIGEIGGLLGVQILVCLGRRFVQGQTPPSEGDIAIETSSDPVLVRACLHVLSEAHLISAPNDQTHARSLVVAPDRVSVGKVLNLFRGIKDGSNESNAVPPGSEKVFFLEVIRRSAQRIGDERPLGQWTIADLLVVD